jgi:hypothetical protein
MKKYVIVLAVLLFSGCTTNPPGNIELKNGYRKDNQFVYKRECKSFMGHCSYEYKKIPNADFATF